MSIVLTVFAFCVLCLASTQDSYSRKVSPILVLVMLAIGLVSGPPPLRIFIALLLAGFGFIVWKVGLQGGGDAKLLPASVLACPFLIEYLAAYVVLMYSCYGVILLIFRGKRRNDLLTRFPLATLMFLAWIVPLYLGIL